MMLGKFWTHLPSNRLTRRVMVLSCLWLVACAPQDIGNRSNSARFADYPDDLFAKIESVCTEPNDRFVRPNRDTVECRSYLPPPDTAAFILRYDGTPERLPQLVLRFQAQTDDPGYLVKNEVYVSVPQRSGGDLFVKFPDRRIDRMVESIFLVAGGQIEDNTSP